MSELKKAGFADFIIEDQGDSLLEMVKGVRQKLMIAEMAISLGKLDLANFDLAEAKLLAQRTLELIKTGTISYTLFKARKE